MFRADVLQIVPALHGGWQMSQERVHRADELFDCLERKLEEGWSRLPGSQMNHVGVAVL